MQLPRLSDIFEATYQIEAILGEGGFATVYRARELATDRVVALKILRPAATGGYRPDVAARFSREVLLLARLRDPHTVLLYDHGQSAAGLFWIAFEYVEGRDLADLLAERGTLPDSDVLHILRQLLQALREAHAHGLVHRDIKPDNVRVYEYMGDPLRVKLLDFGVAREAGGADTSVTRTGALVGTPRYMSPEQLRFEPVTPASDLYSLGVVAYEMLAGPAAMHGHRLGDQIARLGDPNALRLPTHVSARLRAVVDRMVATDVAQRFQSAQEVLDALDHAQPAAPQVHRAPPENRPPPPAAAPPRELNPLLGLAVLGLLVGVVIAILATRDDDRDDRAAPRARTDGFAALLRKDDPTPHARAVRTADAETPDAALTAPDLETASSAGQAPAPLAFDGPEGCGQAPPELENHKLYTDAKRDLFVEVPRPYHPDHRYPVILAFSGAETHSQLLREMRAGDLVRKEQVLVVGLKNRIGQPWNTAIGPEALRAVRRSYCIDPERIYAVGDSQDGGRLVEQIACVMPLRAYATANYRSPPGGVCDRPFAVPALHFTGLNTGNLPVEGGRGCLGDTVASLDAIEAEWRAAHGCDGERRAWLEHPEGTCWSWACATPLVSCHLHGGHGWDAREPDKKRQFLGACDGDPPKLPMIETMWRFFRAQD